MDLLHPRTILLLALSVAARPADAVMFASTADPTLNTTAPTGQYANSGWEHQGKWLNFLGTAIAPQFFITAEHVGGGIGQAFLYQGQNYITDAFYDDPETDLRIWHVTTPFPNFAPLYFGSEEVGKPLVVFGRGRERGAEVVVGSGLAGWQWGASTGVQRWGTNDVTRIENRARAGDLLAAEFDLDASKPVEAHLAVGDSGGGVFIRDTDGVWRLAGINYSVSGPYSLTADGELSLNAALFDESGVFVRGSGGALEPGSGPGEFLATRISSRREFIEGVIGTPEPTTGACVASAAAMLALRRRRG